MQTHRAVIGAVPFDAVTSAGALAAIDTLVGARRGGFVVTPNVDHVVLAHRDAALRSIYSRASLALADGQPLLWIARAFRTPLPEKVSGSDLLDPLMSLAASRGWRVFFFGATEAVSAEAARRLAARHHGLVIAGRDCSQWSPDASGDPDASPVVEMIRAARADLVVVALGTPKQEIWMARHERAIAPAVCIGLGASLDFAAGAVRRAPAWVSHAGLEWAYRLGLEPRRLAYRYLVRDLGIVPIVAGELVRRAGRMARRRAVRPHPAR